MNVITINENDIQYNISIHNKDLKCDKNDNIIYCFNENEITYKLNLDDDIYNTLFYLEYGTYLLCILNNNNNLIYDLIDELFNIKKNKTIEDKYKVLLLQKNINYKKICEVSYNENINFKY